MNKIKWDWGTGIFIVIVIFLIVSIGTTLFFMNQKVDLVASDYYNKGIEHQKQIDRINRTNDLNDIVSIDLFNDHILLTFPVDSSESKFEGSIKFYRPSDSNKDFSLPVTLNDDGKQIIPTKSLLVGYWKVIVEWSQGSEEYYKEKSFVLN